MVSNKEKKDNILLDTLLKYVIPFFNNKKIKKGEKQSKLEELVKKEKKTTKPLELIFLEELVNSFLKNKDIKITKKVKNQEIIEFIENQKNEENKNEIINSYSIVAERKKEQKDNFGYSVTILYEENESEEKLKVKVTFDNNAISKLNNYSTNNKSIINDKNKLNEKEYSFTVTKEKDNKSKDNYSISLIYENNYEQERLSINYKSTIGTYLKRRQDALHDFTDRVPGKNLETFPVSGNEGIYGYTFLGDIKVWRRDDLSGKFAKMVDIHECIHTPDEYETRILTDWIMSKQPTKYIK
ncbi:MAG: hypothetical protein IH934_06265 [Nanoarchaeota archaeon]|nr:hypothetical protein [Nanoarchaeota archaeon]